MSSRYTQPVTFSVTLSGAICQPVAVKVVASNTHRRHSPLRELENSSVQSPYECPARVDAIMAALAASGVHTMAMPSDWGTAPIEAVHHPGLVRFLAEAWHLHHAEHPDIADVFPDVFAMEGLRRGMTPAREPEAIGGRFGYWAFETTTPLTEGTYDAARGAVDISLTATAAVLGGERAAYGLCRPPGHHATYDLYGGYCFFNNAAIAAHHAVASAGARVAVLDVDYHHGNGTQQIFYERDDVLYVSLHGDPRRAYPYVVGFADETGAGRGLGANLNLPLAAGTDDDRYLAVLAQACAAIVAHRPDLLLVSLGLDTYLHDPICDLAVTTEGFGRCGAMVAGLGIPTVILQEGGYAIDALGANVAAWLAPF